VHVPHIPAEKFPNLNLRGSVTAALVGESAARCRGRASWRLPPPTIAPAAALLKHCMLDLNCSLPAATGCIPASSDPDHLPLVVLVRNKHQGDRAEEADGLVLQGRSGELPRWRRPVGDGEQRTGGCCLRMRRVRCWYREKGCWWREKG
jgi:hypothetical protein